MRSNIIQFTTREKKGDGVMCKILKKIHNKTADELLKEYGVYDSIPIDLEKLSTEIGISVMPADFTSLEKKINKDGDILGLVLTAGDNAAIFYRESDSLNRRRFTIAHELGHICKHLVPDSSDYPYIDWRIEEESSNHKEMEANIFAGELLIPLPKLKEIYLSMTLQTSPELAKIFGTSVNVMEERLNYLKVSYYNKEGQVVRNYG